MIDCLSVLYHKMASRQISSTKSQMAPRSFTQALASALYEWLLIFMLFVNSIFSYLITRFAEYSELQSPCILCSRLDHILGSKRSKQYWDLICSRHKSEISSLVYCHAHGKLVDVNGMCETCLFSFATINKSNAETYRLLVGKLGEDSCFGLNNDSLHGSDSTSMKYCTCCNQPWVPRAYTQVAEPEMPLKIPSVGHQKTEKQIVQARDIRRKKVGFYQSPHVGYTQLKIHSDTESEAVFSDDDDGVNEDHRFQTVELEPGVITLPYDLATDKLIDLASAPESSNTMRSAEVSVGHDLEELHLQEIDLELKPASVPALILLDDVPERSENVQVSANALNDRELISFSDAPLTSDAWELAANVIKERELISLDAVPLTSDARELPADIIKERELISLHDVSLTSDTKKHPAYISSRSDARKTPTDVLMKTQLISLDDVPTTSVPRESPANVLKETELISLDDIPSTSEVQEDNISFDEVPQSLTIDKICLEVPKESETAPADNIFPVSESIFSSPEPVEPVAEASTTDCETRIIETEETFVMENDELHMVRNESNTTETTPEAKPSSIPSIAAMVPEAAPSVTETAPEVVPPVTEAASELKSCTIDSALHVKEMGSETNLSLIQGDDALDLTDAYKIAVGNRGKQQSSRVQTEQWTGKDSARVSEDLKALLTQISASRGIELLSPRDISPKISVNSDDMKNLDDMHLLLQKRMLERNESNLSLDGVAVSEIEGESEIDWLKRQVDHDRKLLTGFYKDLEEERSASAVAANQAMAMITRLQEEKASLQMEALQNLRMMEEQAEYDMEAIQKLNDLLAEREREMQDLETELEFYRTQSPVASTIGNAVARPEKPGFSENPSEFEKHDVAEKVFEVDMPHRDVSNMIKNSLLGFEDERLYITDCLEKIEKKLHLFSNNGIHAGISNGGYSAEEREETSDPEIANGETHRNHLPTEENVSSFEKSRDMAALEDEVSELHERLEMLKGDLYFLEHVISSIGHGNEGVQFIKEIASHLQTLRSFSVQRRDQGVLS